MADPGKGSEGSQAPTPSHIRLVGLLGVGNYSSRGGGGGRRGLEVFGHVAIKDT